MDGQLGLWTVGLVAIAWLLVAWTVQSLSAQRWWWLLAETALAVMTHHAGWRGIEGLRRTAADGQILILATVLSFGAIAAGVLVLSQVVLPALAARFKPIPAQPSPALSADNPLETDAPLVEQVSAPEPPAIALPTLPRRRRWALVIHLMLMISIDLLWGGALGLYSPL